MLFLNQLFQPTVKLCGGKKILNILPQEWITEIVENMKITCLLHCLGLPGDFP